MRKKSIIIAFFICLYDQIIKYVINTNFSDDKIICVINRFFYINKVHNTGAAWSMFDGNRIFLIITSIIALGFLIWLERDFEKNTKTFIAFGLIYGGLFGNLIDRVLVGYVTDYFKVVIGSYNYPVFNLADVAIVCGFIILIYCIIKGEVKHDSKSNK